MDFLRRTEEDLRRLASEAKRRLPDLADAIDKAITRLKLLRENYAQQMLQLSGESAPSLAMFRSHEILKPYLVACHRADALPPNVRVMAISGIQLLLNYEAISASDSLNVLKALSAQSNNSKEQIELKILQVLFQLVNWHVNVASTTADSEDLAVVMSEDVLGMALQICINMYQVDPHASVAVSSTALATIRQMINLMTTEAAKRAADGGDSKPGESDMNSCAQCLYLFIQDICMIGRGEPGMWMNGITAPPTLAWEVLSEILLHQPRLLTSTDTFRALRRESIGPLLVQTACQQDIDFGSLSKIIRCIRAILRSYIHDAKDSGDLTPLDDCEPYIAVLLRHLQPVDDVGEQPRSPEYRDVQSQTPRTLLAAVTSRLTETKGKREMEALHDLSFPTSDGCAIAVIPAALALEALLVTLQDHSLLLHLLARRNTFMSGVVNAVIYITSQIAVAGNSRALDDGMGVKASGYSQTMQEDSLRDAYTYRASDVFNMSFRAVCHSISALLEGVIGSAKLDEGSVMHVSTLEYALTSWERSSASRDTNTLHGVKLAAFVPFADQFWDKLCVCLSGVLWHCRDMMIVTTALSACIELATACGVLNIPLAADRVVSALCKFISVQTYRSEEIPTATPIFHWRHVQAVVRLLQGVHILADVLTTSWPNFLETFDQISRSLQLQASDEVPPLELDRVSRALERFTAFTMFLTDDAFLCLVHSLMKLSTSTAGEGELAGPTRMLLDVCIHNCHRLHLFVDSLCNHAQKLTTDARASVRGSAVSVLSDIIAAAFHARPHPTSQIVAVEAVEFAGQTAAIGYILPPVEVLFLPAVHTKERTLSLQPALQADALSEAQLVLVLTRVLSQDIVIVDVSDALLVSLTNFIEQTGQQLTQGWSAIFAILTSVACASDVESSPEETLSNIMLAAANSIAAKPVEELSKCVWGTDCLMIAFRAVQLVVDDFLQSVPLESLVGAIHCLASFGSQKVDVNVSLTAVEMMWKITDFATKQSASSTATDDSLGIDDDAPNELVKKAAAVTLNRLSRLALDYRPEVRNCAINSLFISLVANTRALTVEQWRRAFNEIVFTLLDQIGSRSRQAALDKEEGVAPELKRGVKMIMHHSRDTGYKQWSETHVLAIGGLTRLLRACAHNRLLFVQDWFPEVWRRALETVAHAISLGSFNYEAALAAVETLGAMLQITSEAGFVPNNRMRASAGMRVINGALQQDDSKHQRQTTQTERQLSVSDDESLGLQYEQVKQEYWMSAWSTMQHAIQHITADEGGEVCLALAKCLKGLYFCMADKEFRYSQHVKSLLRAAKYLVRERTWPETGVSDVMASKKYKLTVSFAQREVMSMLQAIRPADVPTCSALLVTLAELATATGLANQSVDDQDTTSSIPSFTVSKEFQELAMQALTTLLVQGMAQGEEQQQQQQQPKQQEEADAEAVTESVRIPSAAKVHAFVEMTSVPGNICLQHLQTRSRWLAAREMLGPRSLPRSISSSTMLASLQLTQSARATPISSPTSRATSERQGVMGVLSSVMGWWYAPSGSSEGVDDGQPTESLAITVPSPPAADEAIVESLRDESIASLEWCRISRSRTNMSLVTTVWQECLPIVCAEAEPAKMQASWGYVVTTLAATLSPWLKEELDVLAPTDANDEVSAEESIGLLAIASESIRSSSNVTSGIQLTVAYVISRSVRVIVAFAVLSIKRIRKSLDVTDETCLRISEELRITQHCVGNLCGFYSSDAVHASIKPALLKELLVIAVDLLNGALLCPAPVELPGLSSKQQRMLDDFHNCCGQVLQRLSELNCTHDLSAMELSCNVGPSKTSTNDTRIYFQSSRPLSQRSDHSSVAEQAVVAATVDDSQLEHVMRDWIASQSLQEDCTEELGLTAESSAVPCTHAMILAPALYHILATQTIPDSTKAQAARLLGTVDFTGLLQSYNALQSSVTKLQAENQQLRTMLGHANEAQASMSIL